MKISFVFILLVSFSELAISQVKNLKTFFISIQKDKATPLYKPRVYNLKKQTTNSDFNYLKIENIDNSIRGTINSQKVMSVFEPLNGKCNYCQFIATFKGLPYSVPKPSPARDIHDILIIKTDSNNIILDAY